MESYTNLLKIRMMVEMPDIMIRRTLDVIYLGLPTACCGGSLTARFYGVNKMLIARVCSYA